MSGRYQDQLEVEPGSEATPDRFRFQLKMLENGAGELQRHIGRADVEYLN